MMPDDVGLVGGLQLLDQWGVSVGRSGSQGPAGSKAKAAITSPYFL
jgi:hypothetical protein